MNAVNRLLAALLLIAAMLSATDSRAQAYCALRDPESSIYSTFPQADRFRSIVKTVNTDARNVIREKLPLDLHFNELGKHTIYVAMSGDRPIGIVHARSEADRWGLIEIAWALDLNLRVVDFRFQRCRNPARKALEVSSFRTQLKNKSFAELRALLTEDAERFLSRPSTVNDSTESLAVTIVHSALKTILVTETVWESDLHSLRVDNLLQEHFEEPVVLDLLTEPYSEHIRDALARYQLDKEINIDRRSLQMFRVAGADQRPLGYLFDLDWNSGTVDTRLLWLLSNEGTVVDVATSDSALRPDFHSSLHQLVNFSVSSSSQCSNALELSAFELGMLARVHSIQ